IPHLVEAGRKAIAPDLPGRAGNRRAGWGLSLDDYAAAIVDVARQQLQPVVTVGHSLGGMVIAAAAQAAPDLFERLVFVSGFMPVSGDSLASLVALDSDSDLHGAARLSWLLGTVRIDPARFRPVYCGDGSDADVAWATARIGPESARPSIGKVKLSPDRFGSVPRSYIRCTEDRALSVQMQDRMIERQPCDKVTSLPASHSPFLSMPDRLAAALLSVI
ncbi:MAG: alpha/beta fold hydrolase, partial [Sphingomonas sp.]|nr:alpha/beta fold hydrolase [Sphingomonas sp.]